MKVFRRIHKWIIKVTSRRLIVRAKRINLPNGRNRTVQRS